jgi:hypothetical protein
LMGNISDIWSPEGVFAKACFESRVIITDGCRYHVRLRAYRKGALLRVS